MKTIYKYPLQLAGIQTINMQLDERHYLSSILRVDVQNGGPYLWAMVDTDAPFVPVKIYTVGTGKENPGCSRLYYAGTYQLLGGAIVHHVFAYISE